MRRDLALAALLLPLSGCYVPPPGPPAYAQPGYPPPPGGYGYVQPGYPPPPGYPAAAYDPYGNAYPGYSYNGGDPTLLVDGAVMPLVLFGGGWGYWDSRHNWHRAPDSVSHHLEEQRASGAFHPGGGDPRFGGAGFRPGGGDPRPGGGGFRPGGGEPRPGGGGFGQPRPAAVPAAAPRPPAPNQPAREEGGRHRECPPGQRC